MGAHGFPEYLELWGTRVDGRRDVSLHYEAFGNAEAVPALVILHGLFGSGENWRTVARELGEQRHVLIPDLPGHGKSPWGDLRYEAMAETVAEFVQQHCARGKAIVLGHSMGGKIAMILALLRPELVEKLVVVDIAPVEDPARHQDIISAQLRAAEASNRKEAEATLAQYIDDAAVRAFLLKNFERDGSGWRHDIQGIAAAYQDILGFPSLVGPDRGTDRGADSPVEGAATTFVGPALFVQGERSGYIDDNGIAAAEAFFPAAEFTTVSEAGHWVHAEKRDEFIAVVTEFFRR